MVAVDSNISSLKRWRNSDALETMISFWDSKLICRFANTAFLNWIGLDAEQAYGSLNLQNVLGNSFKEKEELIKSALEGQFQSTTIRIGTSRNAETEILLLFHSLNFAPGKKGLVLQITETVTEDNLNGKYSQAEKKLIERVKKATEATLVFQLDGIIRIANKSAYTLFGYEGAEFVGENISKFFKNPNKTTNDDYSDLWLPSADSGHFRTIGICSNGEPKQLEISYVPLALGDSVLIEVTVKALSEQKKLEERQREFDSLNRLFVEQSAFALAMVDCDMRYLSASKKWCSDFSISYDGLIGRSHYEIFPEIGQAWKDIHKRCLAGETISCDEEAFLRIDGTVQWLRWDVRPWYKTNGEIGGMQMFSEDLTAIKQRAQTNEKERLIFKKSAQVAKIATWEVIFPNNEVTWSELGYEILELPSDFIPSMTTPYDMCKDDHSRKILREAADSVTAAQPGYDIEIEITTGKGNVKWIRIIAEAEYSGSTPVRRFGIFQDITKSKITELRLAQLNEDLNAVVNSGQVSIINTDLKGKIKYLNFGAEKMLGFKTQSAIPHQDIVYLHDSFELEERKREYGEIFGCELTDFGAITIHAIKGKYEAREWSYISAEKKSVPVQLTVTPIRNTYGKINGFLFVAVDISSIKEVRGRLGSLLDITLSQNKRLKNFAHIVSHNLRSHSANIEMLLDLLLAEHPELRDEQGAAFLVKASTNLKETIAHLGEIVAINAEENRDLESVNLHASIEKASQILAHDVQESGILILNNVPRTISVSAFPAYMDSVMLNLLSNAIKYRNKSTKSYVRFTAEKQDNRVLLEVEDNGLGIDLNLHGDKVFKMYKTFHGNKDSKGVGLFITRNQIEAIGGTIELSSKVNSGTKFFITFLDEKV